MTGLVGNPSAVGVAAPGQVPGTATNDNAAAGKVGEYLESVVVSGSAVALTANTAKSVTSLVLTAGDWDVEGSVFFSGNAATLFQYSNMSVSTADNTQSSDIRNVGQASYGATGLALAAQTDEVIRTGQIRISVGGSTTYYLIAFAGFSVNTASAYGLVRARRVR